MRLKKIVIASVLKPVDDTRMFEKFGDSLAKTSNYDVNIVGFCTKTKSTHPRIHFHPIFEFRRLSFARLFAGLRFLALLFNISPSIIIVTTAELLPAAVGYKLIKGGRLLYDVQENYYRNIIYGQHYVWGIRKIVGAVVQIVERLTSWGIDHFILAEKCYADELAFVSPNRTIVENKYQSRRSISARPPEGGFNLIFTGTISSNYGIFEAVELFRALHGLDQRYRLTIVGYCAHSKTRGQLKGIIKDCPAITTVGLDYLVPHTQVIDHIQQADLGLVAYQNNPATTHRVPTRIYEYLGNRLPMIIPRNSSGTQLCDQFQAGFSIDFDNYDTGEIHTRIQEGKYYPGGNDGDIYWQSEEKKLLQVLGEFS